MQFNHSPTRILSLLMLVAVVLTLGCGRNNSIPITSPGVASMTTPTGTPDLPSISMAAPDRIELPRYESIAFSVTLEAQYTNPYDLRQVSLDGIFTGPDGQTLKVPGFWDGEATWRVRFTPSQVGDWNYSLTVKDKRGESLPSVGKFMVTASNLHGWLQVGNWVNPDFSGHYLVYQDGTPFYGVGHCDAVNPMWAGFSKDKGVGLFDKMKKAGENYVVWWPLYTYSPITASYADYNPATMKVIDLVVADAQAKGVFLVFTIWDHYELRDDTHPGNWGTGHWSQNGFNQLGSLQSFFTSPEAWAWQENFYRYIIARWGYSPAIGMWQTISEINGTNAYEQANPWHEKVNGYFVQNDPYHHPTTASQSGGGNSIPWPEGHKVMDMPQVHIYDPLKDNPIGAASVLAQWTSIMWNEAAKPNWVGEFGVPGNNDYPELFHNSTWAALASGAAITPSKWNYNGSGAGMTPATLADLQRLAQFVSGLPLAQWNPSQLQINSSDPQVRGWGVVDKDGGLFWVQDFSLEGKSIDEVRANQTIRKGVTVLLDGLAGIYMITPYDTWQGKFLTAFTATCTEGQPCAIPLPDFKADMAFKIAHK
jgi:hypothetical protein